MIVIKNVTIIPMTHEVAFEGAVAVGGNKIIMVTQDQREAESFIESQHEEVQVIDGRGGILMPGLINLHNHVSMTLLRSYADDLTLMPWLHDYIWPVEDRMSPEHIYNGARLGIAEMLLGGTTSFMDMYASEDMVAKAAEELGIRVVIGVPFLDQSYPRFEAFMDEMLAKYGKGEGLVSVMMSPHAPYTCSPETMRKAVDFARKRNLRIHTHVAETKDEIEQMRERYGKTPVQYFNDLGLFDMPAVAAHCVYVTDDDMRILAEKGVSVSHNPQSNQKLASGFAPVSHMLAVDINVGLGTDGPSSNNDLDMWEEMRAASFAQKTVTLDPKMLPAYKVLEMATVNGAKAMGRECDLGKIAVGMTADMILIDTSKPYFHPKHDVIANLVYCGKAADVDTVIVNGEIVVRGKQIVKDNLEEIYESVDRAVYELGIMGE